MAKPYRRKGSKFWYIAPMIAGVQMPQSSRETAYVNALKKLRILEGKIATGAIATPLTDRGTITELLEAVRLDYEIKQRRSKKDLDRRIDLHLKPALGSLKPEQINGTVLAEYIRARQTDKDRPAAAASINLELAILKRAFRLGETAGLVSRRPYIEMLPLDNARDTAYSDEQFGAIVGHASGLLADVLTVYGYTGWRAASVLKMQWAQVDLVGGWIALRADQTKNRKATKFPLIPALREIFERWRAETDKAQKETSKIIPWVFHRKGIQAKNVRKSFLTARKAAGLPDHRIHDFRRTAVRALHEEGYDLKTIMDLCGFKTMAMVIRYIGMTADARLLEAGNAIQARRSKPAKVAGTTAPE